MMIDKKNLQNKVLEALDQLRPFLHADGGDMELVDITDDAIVQVRLIGSCSDCSMSMMTLKAGVEEAVKKACPEVKEVVAIDIHSIA